MDELAMQMGYKAASSIQRYFDPTKYKGGYLRRDLVQKLADAVIGKGRPPISDDEVWRLAGPEFAQIVSIRSYAPFKVNQAKDQSKAFSQGVRLRGRVGAGTPVLAIDDGGEEYVEAPQNAKPDTTALEVWGNSMLPAYEDRTLLYYSKLLPPVEMVNKRAVVQLGDGRIYVKVLRRGTTDQTWTLQSLNPHYSDMIDEVVEWAAPIDWIKPR